MPYWSTRGAIGDSKHWTKQKICRWKGGRQRDASFLENVTPPFYNASQCPFASPKQSHPNSIFKTELEDLAHPFTSASRWTPSQQDSDSNDSVSVVWGTGGRYENGRTIGSTSMFVRVLFVWTNMMPNVLVDSCNLFFPSMSRYDSYRMGVYR
jgi:hypothetical protein